MTLEDIAAMDKPFIGTREASEATGFDRYAINLCGRDGIPWMGCKVHFTGQKRKKAVIARLEFLKNAGWEGGE